MTRHAQLLKDSLAAIERLEARLHASDRAKHAPLAIVGVGCRYPGGIESAAELWRVVRDGVDTVSEVPADRWDADAFYSPDPKAVGKMVTKRGGFLSQVDRFDAQVFGISPREAATMDPQQRLLLETAREALESAAIAPDRLSGSATGVFVGITTSDYGQMLRVGGPENSDVYAATGSALNAAAGRIAFTFGLQGPCVAVDTACSSSLVAVHLACQSLRAGESDLALAGGVNVILSPDAMILFSKWGMMAPDGACKTFDAAADGFVRSEGCAMIAVKRLADAVAAGDPILAVIRGSAVNSDGRSSGLTVPNGPAQVAVLEQALSSAGLQPSDIDYVEAHGTGTSLGDPIEVEALGSVMRRGRSAQRPLMIGSIKTNLGHTEAASGLAGLLKVVMALRHEAIPPHLHFSNPNPGIPWASLPLSVPTTLTPWPRGERARRAGVSAFGFSGTNAHVILEEAPRGALESGAVATPGPALIPLSAHDDAGLRVMARQTAERLAADPGLSLADVALTAGTGRAHLGRRVGIVAETREDLTRDLRAFADGQAAPTTAEGTVRPGERPKIAFLFTGQGAQYAGMGRRLYESEPVFRDALDRTAAILAPHLARPLLEVMFPADPASTTLSETAYTQPATFALEYALTELWRARGIAPSMVLGHSVGEYVAATVAGAMSLEDGLALVAERGRLMQALPAGGGMVAIFAPEAVVTARIAPYGDRLSIAALNGPEETVVSGETEALAAVVAGCMDDGVPCRTLDVSHAFHSSRLDPMLDALESRAAGVTTLPPRLTLVSNLTGLPFAPGARPDALYWRRHAREPVRFAAGIDSLRAAGVTALVEVGPHPTLLALTARALPSATWTTAASLRRGQDDRRESLLALARLFARGAPVVWDAVVGGRGGRRSALPTYAFQRQRHWVKPPPDAASGASKQLGSTAASAANGHAVTGSAPQVAGHPLLGERRELASAPGTYVWETTISLELHPWLGDHRVEGAAIVPATAYIEMALASAGDVFGGGSLGVRSIENRKPLILHEGAPRVLQATLVVDAAGVNGEGAHPTASFRVDSRPLAGRGAPGVASPWTAHVTARVSVVAATPVDGPAAIAAARARCGTRVDGGAFYGALAKKGNQWGPFFQGLVEVWVGDGEAIGRVEVPAALVAESPRYRFHPAVSDSCGHALVATVPFGDASAEGPGAAGATSGAFVGAGVGEIRFHASPAGSGLWTHAKLKASPPGQERIVVGDVLVYDASGALVSETLDARLWYLDDAAGGALLGAPTDWFYETLWRAQELGTTRVRPAAPGPWIILGDRAGVAERLAALRAASGQRTVLAVPAAPGAGFALEGDRATVRLADRDDLRRLVDAVPGVTAVLHLASIGASLDEALATGAESVVGLLQAALGARARPRLWLVTADTQAVVEGDTCAAPHGAAVWGIGRALSAEHAELWGGLVDLGSLPASSDASALLREVETGAADDQVAFRGGHRYAARLEHRARTTSGAYAPSPEGTYVVTGGLGGIGLAMAGWLVAGGARHILLLGRSGLPPRASWSGLDAATPLGKRVSAVGALESLGARVEVAAVDVAQDGALEGCLAARRVRGEPPVRGVIHAAGIVQFQALATQDVASLRAGLAAKIDGAWRLHRLLADEPLDCFVLCSSSSSLLRSPLLGVYAGGNTFLDALAHHRRATGKAALSINWGTWGEVGMAVEAGRGSGGSGGMLAGMATIPTSRGLAAMGALLDAGAVQAAVMPIDWRELARAYPMYATDPFLASLVGEVKGDPATAPAGSVALASLRAATADSRPERLVAYLRTEVARTLGMSAEALDPAVPLRSLGFDSLMAVQLKNQIGSDLGTVVPMIVFLEGPSVDQLVPPILGAMAAAPADLPVADVSGGAWEEGSM